MLLRVFAGLLIAAASPLFAHADSGVITGFRMSTCLGQMCTRIESPEVLQGQFGVLTFERVKLIRQIDGKTVVIEGFDGVLNLRTQTLAIRDVRKGPAKDIMYYLESGNLQLF